MAGLARRTFFIVLMAVAARPALGYTDSEISRLLLGHVWCSSHHDRALGYAIIRGFRFTADGVLVMASAREWGGPAGPARDAGNDDERYFWRVQNGMLALSDDQFAWEFMEFAANRDASGRVTLSLDGAQWTACP
ncbi:MAG: hypothetical protein EXQ87_11960 [Alphaproteobacteria bacterium]|nr:hypothetical protein [Alphaproteobacteria bacterium]